MEYEKMSLPELREEAKNKGIKGIMKLKKTELIELLYSANDERAAAAHELEELAASVKEKEASSKRGRAKKNDPVEEEDSGKAAASKTASASKQEGTAAHSKTAAASKADETATHGKTTAAGKSEGTAAHGKTASAGKSEGTAAHGKTASATKSEGTAAHGKTASATKSEGTAAHSKTASAAKSEGTAAHGKTASATGQEEAAAHAKTESPAMAERAPMHVKAAPTHVSVKPRITPEASEVAEATDRIENSRNVSDNRNSQQITRPAPQVRRIDPNSQNQQTAQNPQNRQFVQRNQNATEGRIVTTSRITTQEREALDPNLSPEIEHLDSGDTKMGILEVMTEGYGFIRCDNFLPGENDVYISPAQIRKFNLKTGDIITGNTKVKLPTEKFSALLYIKSINGMHPNEAVKRKRFEDLTPVFPHERLRLETRGCIPSLRIVDLLSPIGKGQRGMIVSQPKAGKTTLLKQIAKAMQVNHPELHIIILLIDERPEEVTDMKESIQGSNVEVIYSTFDELPENHKRVSEMLSSAPRDWLSTEGMW